MSVPDSTAIHLIFVVIFQSGKKWTDLFSTYFNHVTKL